MSNQSSMIIEQARIICPVTDLDEIGSVQVVDGRIDAVVFDGALSHVEAERVDGRGCILTPSFTEINARSGEPGREDVGDLDTLSESAIHGGFSLVCLAPVGSNAIDTRAAAEYICGRSEEIKGASLLPLGNITLRGKGERLTDMFDLAEGGAVAFTDREANRLNPALLRRAMEYAQAVGVPVFEFPQDPYLAGSGVMHEGIVATRLGLKGIPIAAEEIAVARLVALARETKAPIHIGPISAGVSAELIRRAKSEGLPVTASVSSAHLHLIDEDIEATWSTQLRLVPPLRQASDRQALLDGLQDGTIDAISSGHCPLGPIDKQVPFGKATPGMIGLETCLGLVLKAVAQGRLDLKNALRALNSGPDRVIRQSQKSVRTGELANLVLFNAEAKTRVESDGLVTRSMNTAFLGHVLPGQVVLTLSQGRLAYDMNAEKEENE